MQFSQQTFISCLGVLANAFIEELIVRVSSVEDIPANTATQLTSLFKMVQERIPQLFMVNFSVASDFSYYAILSLTLFYLIFMFYPCRMSVKLQYMLNVGKNSKS